MRKVILWINSFLLCFIIALAVFNIYSFNGAFYKTEFGKNRVYDKITDSDLLAEDLRSYFLWEESLKFSDRYSETELVHLSDVKKLFQKEMIVLLAAVVLFLSLLAVQLRLREKIIKTIFLASIISLVVSGLLIIAGVFFENSFVMFHKILFTNDYWLLPYNSTLITLFPQQFFIDFFGYFIITRIAIALALLLLSLVVIYNKPIKKYINKSRQYNRK